MTADEKIREFANNCDHADAGNLILNMLEHIDALDLLVKYQLLDMDSAKRIADRYIELGFDDDAT